MKNDNVVISFAEKLKERKKAKENESAISSDTSEDIAQAIFDNVVQEVERQKENVDLWHEVVDDLFDDTEGVNDAINFASFLNMYSTNLLQTLVDNVEEDNPVNSMVAMSIIETSKPLQKLVDELNERNKRSK